MKKLNQSGFHALPIVVGFLVLGAVAFAGYRVVNSNSKHTEKDGGNSSQPSGDPSKTPSFADQYGDTCKKRDISFTSPPLPFEQMGYIEPLGKVSDGHVTPTDHVYVAPKSMNAADNTTDVIMPADGTVVEVSAMPAEYIGDRSQQTAPEDHRVVIAHSCQYFSILIHVHKLAPALASVVGTQDPNTSKRVSVELKAGDKIGKIGGNPVDWTPIDTSRTLKGFISPSLYKGEPWKLYTVSPFDLYKGSLKTAMEAKSLRTLEPLGGKIDYDKPGKLIGNWFRTGSGGYSGGDSKDNEGRYWDGHLSIAPDYLDGKTTIVSIGNWTGKAQQLIAKNGFDPAKIDSSKGAVKVELAQLGYNLPSGSRWSGGSPVKGMSADATGATVGTIMFEVQKGEKLKVEKFVGKTSAQVSGFTSAAITYER